MHDSTEHLNPNLPAPVTVGIFDSGVGGLSVLRAIQVELPGQPAVYLADQANVPYGQRPVEQVRAFSAEITSFLLSRKAELIVVACNAASAAALLHLRERFPSIPFVGMEPAVKPAAEITRSGIVGVLATPVTFQGSLYNSVVERFARGVRLIQHTCPGLVAEIEAGRVTGDETRRILDHALQPMLAAGIDTIVLGCTHYPFIIPIIQEIVGPDIRVIDPAPAIARQVRRQLSAHNLPIAMPSELNFDQPPYRFFTSGYTEKFERVASMLMKTKITSRQANWIEGKLHETT